MKLYICDEVISLFRLEMEQFGRKQICLIPGWVEGAESKSWGITDAETDAEAIVELKSDEMSIWVPQRCLFELDEQLMMRGRKGFVTGPMTDSRKNDQPITWFIFRK